MYYYISYIIEPASGGAWLSSTRVLICLVKSLNECNPIIYFIILFIRKSIRCLDLLPACGWMKVGLGQVVMPFMDWAIHMIQWLLQWVVSIYI